MTSILVKRALWVIPILFGVSVLSFILIRALPGDYAQAVAGVGTDISPEMLEELRRSLGLDRPLTTQYFEWIAGVFRGDLGVSLTSGQPVLTEIASRVGVTLQLTILAAVMAIALGGLTGLLSGVRGGFWESLVRALNSFGIAIPNFVIATLIVLFAGLFFPWLSIFGYQSAEGNPFAGIPRLLLPAFALAVSMAVVISENLSASMREVEKQDYVLVARAKGLGRKRIVGSYVIKNALTPVVTVTGLQFAGLLGGSIVVETVFAIPGMGQLLFDSVTNRDYPMIQGVVLITAVLVIVVNLIVDLIYIRLDARANNAN